MTGPSSTVPSRPSRYDTQWADVRAAENHRLRGAWLRAERVAAYFRSARVARAARP